MDSDDHVRLGELHDLVHRDPVSAWPHVVRAIEHGRYDGTYPLLEDVIYSDQLPELIDKIEEAARRSSSFRRHLMDIGPGLGGKGGPEMERIFILVRNAEAEFAVVVEFDDESELKSLRRWPSTIPAAIRGKTVIFKRRGRP